MTDEELKKQRPKYYREKHRRRWVKGAGPIGIETMTYLLANPQEMLWDNYGRRAIPAAFVVNYQARTLYNQLMGGRFSFAFLLQPNQEKETGE